MSAIKQITVGGTTYDINDPRVDNLSGGGKLYIHTLTFYYDDLNTQPCVNPYDFTIRMISTDGTPITTPEQLYELRTRFQTNIGVFYGEWYFLLPTFFTRFKSTTFCNRFAYL